MEKKKQKTLKITQTKSVIGHRKKAKRTITALGLKKMHQTVTHVDTPEIRGMIQAVGFLVKVEEE